MRHVLAGILKIIAVAVLLVGVCFYVVVNYSELTQELTCNAIGGLAKAYYSFVVENHAFEYKRITGNSSPWAKDMLRLKSLDQMEDRFDPLEVWYLYFVKPLVGATLGLIFALTIDIGLITLGAKIDDSKHTTRLVVMAAMAGLFAENVLSRLQGFFMTAKDT